jgi:hypothetical protein
MLDDAGRCRVKVDLGLEDPFHATCVSPYRHGIDSRPC